MKAIIKISVGVIGVTLAGLACAAGVKAMNSRLVVSPGADARTAAISGPEALTSRAVGRPVLGSCGFEVDWGDTGKAVFIMGECASGLRHTYAAAGTYAVRARTFHAAQGKAREPEWSGTSTVDAR